MASMDQVIGLQAALQDLRNEITIVRNDLASGMSIASSKMDQIAGLASSATARLDVSDGNIQKLFDQ